MKEREDLKTPGTKYFIFFDSNVKKKEAFKFSRAQKYKCNFSNTKIFKTSFCVKFYLLKAHLASQVLVTESHLDMFSTWLKVPQGQSLRNLAVRSCSRCVVCCFTGFSHKFYVSVYVRAC